MVGCSALETLDLGPLECVTSIGDKCLCGNAALRELDLTPLRNIQTIGHNFLNNCRSLKYIDFRPLQRAKIKMTYSFISDGGLYISALNEAALYIRHKYR